MAWIKALSAAATALAGPVNRAADLRWYAYPFGRAPRGTRAEYERRAAVARAEAYPEVDAYEREQGFRLDPEWLHDLALHTQVTVKKSEVCYPHGRLLYAALRTYLQRRAPRAVVVLETGTARGFATLCMARALDDAGVPGTILTYDVLPHDVPMYWNCIDDLDGPRSRAELLRPWTALVEEYVVFHQGDTLRELPRLHLPRVNFAFLDGQHTYRYVMADFHAVRGGQRPGDVVFFDDYDSGHFPGVVQAVDEICEREGYEKRTLRAHSGRGYVVAVKH